MTELAQTLAIAFRQRQKPQVVKTKYDYLITDAVLSAGEFELAARSARKKAVDIEQVLIDEFQVKLPAIGAALSKFFGVPYEPFKADRIKPMDLLKNLKREYVESNQWVPIDDTKEGLVVLCLDPERIRSSRIASNVFPEAQARSTASRRRRSSRTRVNQFYGAEAVDTGDIGDMLSGLDDDEPRAAMEGASDDVSAAADNELVKLVNKIIIDAYNQGASDIHIEPYPGKAKTEIRFRKDGIARALHRGAGELPHRASPRASRSCATWTSRRSASRRTARSSSRSSARSTSSCAWRPSRPQGGVEDIVMRILAAGEPIPLDKMGFTPRNLESCRARSASPTACSSSAARPARARPPRCIRCSST